MNEMPTYESALLGVFDTEENTAGLMLDADGNTVGGWIYTDPLRESDAVAPDGSTVRLVNGGASTTTSGYSVDHLEKTGFTDPYDLIHDENTHPAHEWHESGGRVVEITTEGLVEISHKGGQLRPDAEVVEDMSTGDHRCFIIIEGDGDAHLAMKLESGMWVGDSCGPDLSYDGPFPHTGDDLDAIVEDCGYDTPFLDFNRNNTGVDTEAAEAATRALHSVASIVVAGRV